MDLNPIRKKRADELKQMRLEKNISQEKLSEISGLHRATIARIESGRIGWNVDSEFVYFETLNKL
jgi:transcriptional regulator with XRE-family HTH domain